MSELLPHPIEVRIRYRMNWRGKLILQVEVTYNNAASPGNPGQTFLRWRDARLADLDLGVV